jgi:fatty acid/phospholipid biosynthesis enzyme
LKKLKAKGWILQNTAGALLLLGVKAPFFICHGSSKAKDIKSAIGVAVKCVSQW